MESKNQALIEQTFESRGVEVCQKCKTVYQLILKKPGEDYNDFGIRFCPYCGDATENLINYKLKIKRRENNVE